MKREAETQFNSVYQTYYKDIYKYALSRLSCDETYAADCTQEAFLVYYQKLKAGEVIDNPRAYLYKTATLLIKKRYAAVQTEQQRLASIDDYEHSLKHIEEGSIIARLDFAAFEAKLNALLNEEEKKLYRLRFLEDRSVTEIAALYEMKPHAVTMRIARLRNKIITNLSDYFGKEDV